MVCIKKIWISQIYQIVMLEIFRLEMKKIEYVSFAKDKNKNKNLPRIKPSTIAAEKSALTSSKAKVFAISTSVSYKNLTTAA